MKRLTKKGRMLWLALLILVLLAGCRRGAEPTPEATVTPAPAPFDVTFCDIAPSDMCLEGFGLDEEERLLILFKIDDLFFANIYIRADGPDGEIFFECQQSEEFVENVYCLGETVPEDELIKLNIYSKSNDRLIAIGVFNVQYDDLPAPDVVFATETTPISTVAAATATVVATEASYPNPSYPNPSYPNPPLAP